MSHIGLRGTQEHLKDEISNWCSDNIDSRNFSSGLRLSKILKIRCLSENITKLIFFSHDDVIYHTEILDSNLSSLFRKSDGEKSQVY